MTTESVPSKELRLRWGDYLDRARAGESFLVTRGGRATALLVPPELEERSAAAEVEE